MKKINLGKYGFIREESQDFIDDGNKFTCYRIGKVRVTKLVSRGDAYINARIDSDKLCYEEYKTLPHYENLNKLNGVSLESITEQDLKDLYIACIEYEKEYNNKLQEVSVNNPTKEQVKKFLLKEREIYKKQVDEINSRFNLIKFSKIEDVYDCKDFYSYFNSLNNYIKSDDYIEILATREVTLPNGYTRAKYTTKELNELENKLNDGFYYKTCIKILAGLGM